MATRLMVVARKLAMAMFIKKEKKMKRILVLCLLFTAIGLAQPSTPIDSTTHYYMLQFAQGAKPGASALNTNLDKIDSGIWSVANDSCSALRTWTNTVNGKVVDSSAALRAYVNSKTGGSLVDLSSSQTITGAKIFSGGVVANLLSSTPHSQEIQSAQEGLSAPTSMVINLTATAPNSTFISVDATGINSGTIIYIVNVGGTTLTAEDVPTGGGNLQLAGNFTMTAGSTITLMYNTAFTGGKWVEISRSTNS